MSQEIINIGTLPNDGTGDPLRVAYSKINNNFTNLFSTATVTSSANTTGITSGQVIFSVPTSDFTHGTFQIRTTNTTNNDSQDITLSAQIITPADVKWTGYATTINGNALVTYDMTVVSSNVRIVVNPLANLSMTHFVSASITVA